MTSESVAFAAIVFAACTFGCCALSLWLMCRVLSAMAVDLERLRSERYDGVAESMRRNFRLQEAEERLERIRREFVEDDANGE